MSTRSFRYSTMVQHFGKGRMASTDRDALAFIEAAGIYNTNQQKAIVDLVRGLKRTGLWSKMKAIYPFIGGTASSHKWNLKDPRDADAAFRLTFSGGWTHSSTGALPNGTNAYADTFLNAQTNLTYLSWGLSYYSRTNDNTTVQAEIRCYLDGAPNRSLMLRCGRGYLGCDFPDINFATQSTSLGYWIGTTRSATERELYYNGVSETTSTANLTTTAPNAKLFLGAANDRGLPSLYSRKQCAFATIGDGLTDTEASNLYNIVQRYQFQLGRAIEPDAQAFIDAAGITDATQQAAILDLVVRLKNDGLWTKMKAIYPFVGGTATTHKWNLKDPRDADAAFRLTFSGGWTHSSTGATPNGTNAYGDTYWNDNTNAINNNNHMSIYSRTNSDGLRCDFGVAESAQKDTSIFSKYNNVFYPRIQAINNGIANTANSLGYFVSNRVSSTEVRAFQNNTLKQITNAQIGKSNGKLILAALNVASGGFSPNYYSNREYAFATIGDGLTDSEASALYNIVDLYQKRLGRAV